MEEKKHWSDCAVYNEPAMRAGKCDCNYKNETITILREQFDRWQEVYLKYLEITKIIKGE